MFFDSENGATASSCFYSLIESAKANNIEPYSYFMYIFEQIPLCKHKVDCRALLPSLIDRSKVKALVLEESGI